jgi:hypothetical protein
MNATNSKRLRNKKLEDLVTKSKDAIIYSANKYYTMQNTIQNTPIQIKIINILVPFIFTYIFTFIYYNLGLSIFFSIITFLVISLLSKLMAMIFIILYIFILSNISNEINAYIGKPIFETDIILNKKPFDCLAKSLTINNNVFPQNNVGDNFTYSFWLYVNGNNNCINKDNNWNTYRNNEWKSIFYRGTPINEDGNLTNLVQFPGFWLTPVLNNLVIVLKDFS